MGNCFEACHGSFEETVGMVGDARGLTSETVKATLSDLGRRFQSDPEFRRLRGRLPAEFPF